MTLEKFLPRKDREILKLGIDRHWKAFYQVYNIKVKKNVI